MQKARRIFLSGLVKLEFFLPYKIPDHTSVFVKFMVDIFMCKPHPASQ